MTHSKDNKELIWQSDSEYAETVAVLKERIAELNNGVKGIPMEDVFSELAKEFAVTFES